MANFLAIFFGDIFQWYLCDRIENQQVCDDFAVKNCWFNRKERKKCLKKLSWNDAKKKVKGGTVDVTATGKIVKMLDIEIFITSLRAFLSCHYFLTIGINKNL